eukprot:3819093-Pyramimonas_sp.AAC.1
MRNPWGQDLSPSESCWRSQMPPSDEIRFSTDDGDRSAAQQASASFIQKVDSAVARSSDQHLQAMRRAAHQRRTERPQFGRSTQERPDSQTLRDLGARAEAFGLDAGRGVS